MARPKSEENLSTAEALELSLQEARAARLAKHKAKASVLNDVQSREEFRKYWAIAKNNYAQVKDIEDILWLHAKSINKTKPEDFDQVVEHFGLKKLGEK